MRLVNHVIVRLVTLALYYLKNIIITYRLNKRYAKFERINYINNSYIGIIKN